MLNRISLVGRLTRDPELRTTTTGKNYATFAVAVNKRIKPQDPNERDADFFNVKVWGQTAEYVSNYLTKGRLVAVDGRMESRKYTDQQGVQREIWEVTADNVSGLDRPKDDQASGGGGDAPAAARPAYGGGARPAAQVAPSPDEYDPFADE
ncbi:MAG: single-stranded DNA-binding protein [Fimbriimonas sp.]